MRTLGTARVFGFYGAMAAVGLVAHGWYVGWTFEPARLAFGLLAGGLTGLFLVIVTRVLVRRFGWARRLAFELQRSVGELSRREALVLAVASGLAEEALFRGVLLPALGLWLSAAIFGVMHVGPNRYFVPWSLMALGAGLIFGGLVAVTGTLVAPIAAHIVVNYLNLLYLCTREPAMEVHLGPVARRGLAKL